MDRLMGSKRQGEWMQTYTGRAFWPIDPRVEDIDIRDIAHSLSLQCRFAGHTRQFYSVAQHSVLVAQIVPVQDILWALLHDASEAYLVDLPRPVKDASALGDEYKAIERRLMGVICRRFGLSEHEPESIQGADNAILMAEARDLLSVPPRPWKNTTTPVSVTIEPWLPERAEREFLNLATWLTGEYTAKNN